MHLADARVILEAEQTRATAANLSNNIPIGQLLRPLMMGRIQRYQYPAATF
jgi:hypothetical protein